MLLQRQQHALLTIVRLSMLVRSLQVGSLMWLHTVLQHQYKTGLTLSGSLRELWAQGGVRRLYRGLPFALVLAPATRFLDTAANAGCMSLLEELEATRELPVVARTLCGSVVASVARLSLLPLDIAKTVMQVQISHVIDTSQCPLVSSVRRLTMTALLYG